MHLMQGQVGPTIAGLYQRVELLLVAFRCHKGFMFIWHVLAALRGEPGASEAVETARARVLERWSWEDYDGFFERLIGRSVTQS